MFYAKGLQKFILFLSVVFLLNVCFYNSKIKVYANSAYFTIVAKDKTYNFSEIEVGKSNGKYYLKNAKEVVDGIYLDTVKRPINATLTFNPNNINAPFEITKESNGEEFSKQVLLDKISANLNGGNNIINVDFYTVKPQITANELKKQTFLRSEFSTAYPNSIESRKHNIKTAVEKINGTVVPSGVEFSFNKTVGARTEENGFMNATVIENGEYTEGVGGGVCQVSSTLYNAVLLSGLKTTERHSHSLSVNYVEPSFDAMVSSGTSDLKFVNNSGENIYIQGIANGTNIIFKIYGLKMNENYKRVSVTKEVIKAENPIIEYDNNLNENVKEVKTYAKDGLVSEAYLVKYVNGKEVENKKLHTDKYKTVRAKIVVGTKKESIGN